MTDPSQQPKLLQEPQSRPIPVDSDLLRQLQAAADYSWPFSEVRDAFLAEQASGATRGLYFVPDQHPLSKLAAIFHTSLLSQAPHAFNATDLVPKSLVVEASERHRGISVSDVLEHKRLGMDLVPQDAPVSLIEVDSCSFVQFQEPGQLKRLQYEQQVDREPFKAPDESHDLVERLLAHAQTCPFDRVSRYYYESIDSKSLSPYHELFFVAPSVKLEDAAATILHRQKTHVRDQAIPELLSATRAVLFGHHHSALAALIPNESLGVDLVPCNAACTVLKANRNLFVQLDDSLTWQRLQNEQRELRNGRTPLALGTRRAPSIEMEP